MTTSEIITSILSGISILIAVCLPIVLFFLNKKQSKKESYLALSHEFIKQIYDIYWNDFNLSKETKHRQLFLALSTLTSLAETIELDKEASFLLFKCYFCYQEYDPLKVPVFVDNKLIKHGLEPYFSFCQTRFYEVRTTETKIKEIIFMFNCCNLEGLNI